MSDQPDGDRPKEEEKFDLPASTQFIAQRNGLQACYCGKSQWISEAVYRKANEEPSGPPTRAAAYLYKTSNSFWGRTPAIPLLVLTCENCGNVRTYNLAWIKAQMNDEGAYGQPRAE